MAGRWRFYVSFAVLAFGILASFVAADIEWSNRFAMLPDNPAEATEQALFGSELFTIGALNVLATLVFLVGRSGWAWSVVLATQVGIFVFAIFRGLVTDPGDIGWVEFSLLPLMTAVLLVAIRLAKETPQGRSVPAGV